jgi:lysozyme
MHHPRNYGPVRLSLAPVVAAFTLSFGLAARTPAQFIQGVDVSNHQASVNWTSMKSAGIQFAFCKATEGVDFIDAQFTNNMTGGGNAGVYIGPYHFARVDSFESDPEDAAKEAADFVDAIRPYYQTPSFALRPVLDLETVPNDGRAIKPYLSQWVRDFAEVVETELGFAPIIYTNTNYAVNYLEADIAQYPLWLANWNYAPPNVPPASADGIWNGWDFWQYSSTGNIGGESPVDRDVYQGTLEQMLAEFQGVQPHGDFNQDGDVDGGDYLTWQKWNGSTGAAATFARGDANGDRKINAADLAVWSAGFGQPPASGAPALTATPEPSSAALAAAMIAAFASARRRLRHCVR